MRPEIRISPASTALVFLALKFYNVYYNISEVLRSPTVNNLFFFVSFPQTYNNNNKKNISNYKFLRIYTILENIFLRGNTALDKSSESTSNDTIKDVGNDLQTTRYCATCIFR